MSSPAKPEAAPAAAVAQDKSGGSMLPVILVVVLVPALCYGATNYLLLPKLKASLLSELAASEGAGGAGAGEAHGAKPASSAKPAAAAAKSEGHGKKEGTHGAESGFEFGTTVVNLTGAMGQRFLRANFVLSGGDAKFEEIVKENQSALRDVAINVLSSQSLASIEAPGAKNLIRNELITQFNRTLGAEVVDQLYFSEFVVQ